MWRKILFSLPFFFPLLPTWEVWDHCLMLVGLGFFLLPILSVPFSLSLSMYPPPLSLSLSVCVRVCVCVCACVCVCVRASIQNPKSNSPTLSLKWFCKMAAVQPQAPLFSTETHLLFTLEAQCFCSDLVMWMHEVIPLAPSSPYFTRGRIFLHTLRNQ